MFGREAGPRRSAPPAAALRSATAVLTIVLALTGCTRIDDFWASLPFLSMMREAPSFDPYEVTRPPPPHSVPYESPAGEILPPMAPTEAGLRALEGQIRNPLPADSAALARGADLYGRYCLVCHGPEGRGRNTGPVTATGAYPAIAPPLVEGNALTLSDSYLYGIIRVGRGLMPAYGGQVQHLDRWFIVQYVRQLQRTAGTGAAAPNDTTAAGN